MTEIKLGSRSKNMVSSELGEVYEGWKYSELVPPLLIVDEVRILFMTRSALENFQKHVARLEFPNRTDLYGDV